MWSLVSAASVLMGQDSQEPPTVLAGSRVAGPSADSSVVQRHQRSPLALISSQKLVSRRPDGYQAPVPAMGRAAQYKGGETLTGGFALELDNGMWVGRVLCEHSRGSSTEGLGDLMEEATVS